VDDVTWAALTLTLTILGAIWTWLSFQRRGLASGLRAAAFTLLPLAAYLTRTLRLITRIAGGSHSRKLPASNSRAMRSRAEHSA